MFFCPNCRNAFDIARTSANMQGGELNDTPGVVQHGAVDYTDFISKALKASNFKEKDVSDLNIEQLIKSIPYKKLSTKKKEHVYNVIQDALPKDKKILMQAATSELDDANLAFFVCKNCMFSKPIKEGTLIFSKTADNSAKGHTTLNVENYKNSHILPYTRKYICNNKECPSHKDASKKEARIYRPAIYARRVVKYGIRDQVIS